MPTTKSDPDRLIDQDTGRGFGVLTNYWRMIGISAALGMSIIFGLAAWYALHGAKSNQTMTTKVPLIRADANPVKIKPMDPGGLKVPNQDKLVFERITPENKPTVEEKLAPAPEEPIVTSEVAIEKMEPQNSDMIINSTKNKKGKLGLAPQTEIKTSHENVDIGYKIQMAAFRNKDQAEKSWAKIKNSHVEILGALTPFTERIDLGKKGVYFRLQAGYYNVVASARGACAKLKEKGQDCIVVRPK